MLALGVFIFGASHFAVEERSQLVDFQNSLNGHLRLATPRGGLQADLGQTHPALQQIAREVDVLNPTIRQVDLLAKEYAPLHGDSRVIEPVAQGDVTHPEREEDDGSEGARHQRTQEVVFQQASIRSLNASWVEVLSW